MKIKHTTENFHCHPEPSVTEALRERENNARQSAPTSNSSKDANLLRDIVPNFNRMATNIFFAARSTTDPGADESITRRSDALGRYFQEHVFVPAVSSVDTTSWHDLCCQILAMARCSSTISNAIVALSQLHFNKFFTTTEHNKGPHALRNGENLSHYLYIFARESLIEGLEQLKVEPSASLRRELLIGLFLLTCFEVSRLSSVTSIC